MLAKYIKRGIRIIIYQLRGRKPWSRGYFEYKWKSIGDAISNKLIMEDFSGVKPLPDGYGRHIDERIVEFPWALSRIPETPLTLLDAGSTLNFINILQHSKLKNKKTTIVTLAPESNCFWKMGVSYVYDDIRILPFRDEQFDIITCLSTLEHVGMDNTQVYTSDKRFSENNKDDYKRALLELKRVLRPSGRLLLTVPYGAYADYGFFQQFDEHMIKEIVDTFEPSNYDMQFFKYHAEKGWSRAMKNECDNVLYVGGKDSEIAGATAVVGVELVKI